ncbi:helix-turn-helix domain-containing protein [Paenibacillus sp. SYP-B4298]|uniref:helix-turn-helix domain-containing protein n=1 Tax=Paenibacillus sp. SYP-B4298 TaxID=2996034 RepID=UPI0022DDA61F|nr:helix-turn-helix domain-containing protein [Paenibacillus sp. SYP-B4298]
MISYELLGAQTLADSGTAYPVPLSGSFPAIIVPSEDIIIHTAHHFWHVGKGQFITLLQAEAAAHLEPAVNEQFGSVYIISFHSYRLVSRETNRLIYETDTEQLPKHGQIMEFPRHAESLMHNLLELYRQSSTHSKLHVLLYELLDVILANRFSESIYQTSDKAIQMAVAYIQQHYKSRLTRASLAKMTGFNDSYFSSLFRKETGWSYAEYVNRIRIDRAKHLLLGTTYKLQEIANQTGFTDSSYLGKTFSKTVHLSPSSFRSRRRSRRIVGLQFLGSLMALGIKPLAGAREVLHSSLLLRRHMPDIVELEEWDQIEALQPLAPDIIVAPTYVYSYPDVLKKLETIAPVLTLPWGQMDKLEEVRMLGTLLGRSQEAENWVTRLLQAADKAKQEISPFISEKATVGLFELWHDGSWLIPHLPVRSAYNLFKLLGLTPPQRVRQEVLQTGKHRFIQEEELYSYSATHMFLIVPTDDTEAYRVKLMQRFVWQQLVYNHGCQLHLLKLNEFWYDDGLSLELQLEVLVTLLAASC